MTFSSATSSSGSSTYPPPYSRTHSVPIFDHLAFCASRCRFLAISTKSGFLKGFRVSISSEVKFYIPWIFFNKFFAWILRYWFPAITRVIKKHKKHKIWTLSLFWILFVQTTVRAIKKLIPVIVTVNKSGNVSDYIFLMLLCYLSDLKILKSALKNPDLNSIFAYLF